MLIYSLKWFAWPILDIIAMHGHSLVPTNGHKIINKSAPPSIVKFNVLVLCPDKVHKLIHHATRARI